MHPNPVMNELHVDNAFQMTRRAVNAFERPPGTSNSQNTGWHSYQPQNPAMIGKYLTVFRTATNFISVGLDGKTPAMRLGLAKQPPTCEDILWPDEAAPKPWLVSRKGRRLRGLQGTSRVVDRTPAPAWAAPTSRSGSTNAPA